MKDALSPCAKSRMCSEETKTRGSSPALQRRGTRLSISYSAISYVQVRS
jgi:hypothetical protein